jgi:MerR family copper efflux transcriptional regulator
MRIGDLAKRTGITTSRIRFYEGRGLLQPAARCDNGYRDYPTSTIATLDFIERAQALGFSLKEIGAAVPLAIDGGVAKEKILPALERKLRDVEAHIASSIQRRTRLRELIAEQRRCCAEGEEPDR